MSNDAVVKAAIRNNTKDEAALELLIGMQDKALSTKPGAAADPDFEPVYEKTTMGPLDDLKALGRRIVKRWNRELFSLVCEGREDDETRTKLLAALKLNDAAALGVIATALMALGAPAAIAAALAPLLLKKFINPAKDELCAAWGEAIAAGR